MERFFFTQKTSLDFKEPAMDTAFREATVDAAQKTPAAGRSVVGERDGRLVRLYPDGSIEDIGPLHPIY